MATLVSSHSELDLAAPHVAAQFPADAEERSNSIKRCIQEEDKRVKEAHPWLLHQDLIGGGIFSACVLTLLSVATIYMRFGGGKDGDGSGWWWAVPLMAIPISILHEMEHDLIHNMYFKKNKLAQDFMFYIIWLTKLHANPWYRRKIHLWHHAVSGQKNDVEERLVGLGLPFGLERLALILHPQAGAWKAKEIRDTEGVGEKMLHLGRFMVSNLPTAIPFVLITKLFYIMGAVRLFFPTLLESIMPGTDFVWVLARDAFVLLAAPNLLRQGSLNFITTSCHYYGDIPKNEVFYQNQILDHWLALPFQLFCFNFGSTHIIHHFVPGQTFYVRQMVAPAVHKHMKELGIRHNDMGINYRGNRWVRSENESYEELMGKLYFVAAIVVGIPLQFLTDIFISGFIGKIVVWDMRLKRLFNPKVAIKQD